MSIPAVGGEQTAMGAVLGDVLLVGWVASLIGAVALDSVVVVAVGAGGAGGAGGGGLSVFVLSLGAFAVPLGLNHKLTLRRSELPNCSR